VRNGLVGEEQAQVRELMEDGDEKSDYPQLLFSYRVLDKVRASDAREIISVGALLMKNYWEQSESASKAGARSGVSGVADNWSGTGFGACRINGLSLRGLEELRMVWDALSSLSFGWRDTLGVL